MEYTLAIQRLSSGEHVVTAFPVSGEKVMHRRFSSWPQFKCVFSKYMDDSAAERLNSILAESPFGVPVFENELVFTGKVLRSVGFK